MLAVRNGAKLIVINLEPTPVDSTAQVVIHDNAAVALPQIMDCMESIE
jgi:NAD-dependent SIR2 family protein deacetylase